MRNVERNIRYNRYEAGAPRNCGVMPVKLVNSFMVRQGQRAAELMRASNADHVLYGCKVYKEDQLAAVQFYMEPLTDEEFYRITGRARNVLIYALHNHGGRK